MRFYNLEQGSDEWLDWRKSGIGASDTPIIMGVSPFATPLQLYEDKKGLSKKVHNDWATRKGHQMEPSARMSYEILTGIEMHPVTVAHDEFSWLKASLDGWNDKHKLSLEIKFPGKKDWNKACRGKIPEYYELQLQHQLLVTGREKCHYYAFNGQIGRLIVVEADAEKQHKILHEAGVFMERLRKNDPPPLTDRDTKDLTTPALVTKVNLYRKLKAQIAVDTEALKAVEKDLLKVCDHPRCNVNGLKVITYKRKGTIDWSKFKESYKDINFEAYRKEGFEVTQFRDEGDDDVS